MEPMMPHPLASPEICERLPEELLRVEDPDTHKKVRVRPGVRAADLRAP